MSGYVWVQVRAYLADMRLLWQVADAAFALAGDAGFEAVADGLKPSIVEYLPDGVDGLSLGELEAFLDEWSTEPVP